MHLRSGTILGRPNSSAPSKVTTQGSGTRSIGNLENILEGSTTDSQSDTSSTLGSEMDHGPKTRDLEERKASSWSKAKMRENSFEDPLGDMEFKVMLTFQYENVFGTEIYLDPLDRYAFKTVDNRTPFNKFPMVNYQGDLYMGKDGSRYEVTRYPQQVDACGVLKVGPMSSKVSNHEARPTSSMLNTAGTSTNPTGLGAPHKPNLDKLFASLHLDEEVESFKWTPIKAIKVTKVFQDDLMQEVFRDSADTYYATTRLTHLQFLVQHTLTLEQSRPDAHIRDEQGNQFRTMEWYEVRDLTWKGKPLFSYVAPTSTARPRHVVYSAEIKAPKSEPTLSEWTSARRPPPPWSVPHAHEEEGRIDPNLGRHERRRPPREGARSPSPQRDGDRVRPPRKHDDENRKVRPSALQKLVKKYDGSGDPYDHVAAFRQDVHAERVKDTHTQIEGFGLTLESKALSWFQTLEPVGVKAHMAGHEAGRPLSSRI